MREPQLEFPADWGTHFAHHFNPTNPLHSHRGFFHSQCRHQGPYRSLTIWLCCNYISTDIHRGECLRQCRSQPITFFFSLVSFFGLSVWYYMYWIKYITFKTASGGKRTRTPCNASRIEARSKNFPRNFLFGSIIGVWNSHVFNHGKVLPAVLVRITGSGPAYIRPRRWYRA